MLQKLTEAEAAETIGVVTVDVGGASAMPEAVGCAPSGGGLAWAAAPCGARATADPLDNTTAATAARAVTP